MKNAILCGAKLNISSKLTEIHFWDELVLHLPIMFVDQLNPNALTRLGYVGLVQVSVRLDQVLQEKKVSRLMQSNVLTYRPIYECLDCFVSHSCKNGGHSVALDVTTTTTASVFTYPHETVMVNLILINQRAQPEPFHKDRRKPTSLRSLILFFYQNTKSVIRNQKMSNSSS